MNFGIDSFNPINVKRTYKYKDLVDRVNELTEKTESKLSTFHNNDISSYFSNGMFDGDYNSDELLLSDIQRQINQIIVQSNGKVLTDKKFLEISERISQLEEVKRTHDFGRVVSDTERNLIYLEKLQGNCVKFKDDVNLFVNKTRKDNYADLDFSKVESLSNRVSLSVKLLKTLLHNKEHELQIFHNLYTLKNISYDLENDTKKIENELKNTRYYKLMSELKAKESEIKAEITKLEESNKQTVSTILKDVPAKDINNAMDDVAFINKGNNFLKNFTSQRAMFIEFLLKDCNNLTGDDLRKKIEENQNYYNKASYAPYVNLAKEITEYLLFEKEMTPQDLLKISESDAEIEKIRCSVIEDIRNKNKHLNALSQKHSQKGSLPFFNIVCNLEKNRELIAYYKNDLDYINKKRPHYTNKLEKTYSKINSNFKKTLNRYIDSLKSLGVKKKTLEEIKRILDSAESGKEGYILLHEVAKKIDDINLSTYNSLLTKLPEYSEEIQKYHNAIENKDINTIEDMVSKTRLAISHAKEKLNLENDVKHQLRKINTETMDLYRENLNLMYDMDSAKAVVNNTTTEIDETTKNTILAEMVSIYKTLNDCRKANHTNSQSYINMISPLTNTLNKKIPVYNQPLNSEVVDFSKLDVSLEQLTTTLRVIKDNANRYLADKGRLHCFSSVQARQRHRLANKLISMCDNATEQIAFANNYKRTNVNNRIKDYNRYTEGIPAPASKELNDQKQIIHSNVIYSFSLEKYNDFINILNDAAKKQDIALSKTNAAKKESHITANNMSRKQSISL